MDKYFHAWNVVFEGLPKPFWQLYKHYSNLDFIWDQAQTYALQSCGISSHYIKRFQALRQSFNIHKEHSSVIDSGIQILTIRNEGYPKVLRSLNTHLPPMVLYVRGTLPSKLKTHVSIVGTRQMTAYGEAITEKIVGFLKPYDIVINSGMANGVDSLAHRTALDCNLQTIAVLGFGLNHIPAHKKKFAELIAHSGAVISEYPPNLSAQKYHFPLRNRIISGLSKLTVIVEAGNKSGALITAQYALDQGKEVASVPGSILSEKSVGTNRLIKDGSAHTIARPSDLLDILQISPDVDAIAKTLSRRHRGIFEILKKQPLSIHELIDKTNLPVSTLSSLVIELELEGITKKSLDGRYYIK